MVQVGAVFAVIESDQNIGTEIVEQKEELSEMEIESEILKPLEIEEISNIKLESTSERFYSPLVKSIAKKESISQNELDKISGTGSNGRVTKKDMLNYLENKSTKTQPTPTTTGPKSSSPAIIPSSPSPSLHPTSVTYSCPLSSSSIFIDFASSITASTVANSLLLPDTSARALPLLPCLPVELLRLLLHDLEQVVTSSQHLSHFFRHVKGR